MRFLVERRPPRVGQDLKKQPDKGFTVLELMVVIACTAILAAVATPAFVDYLRDAGLKDAVHTLSGDLYRAKSQAIRVKTNQTVTLNQGADDYNCPNPNRTVFLSNYWGEPVFIANPDGGLDTFSSTIVFDTRGLLTPRAARQAYLTSNNRTFRVQVSAAGAVSIHEWISGAWTR